MTVESRRLGQVASLEQIRRLGPKFVAPDVAVVHIEDLEPGLGSFADEAANSDVDSLMKQLFADPLWCCRCGLLASVTHTDTHISISPECLLHNGYVYYLGQVLVALSC